MKFELDHIVHFVESPELAAKEFQQAGLLAVAGGTHEMWGTYNALCYLGLSYIELIGVFDEELLEKSSKQRYSLHETYKQKGYQNGLTRLALRVDNIQEVAEMFRAQGYDVYGPEVFSRVKPDGNIVAWQLLHVGKTDQEIDLPFFIQWNESDNERLSTLTAQGWVNKGSIEKVSFLVQDVNAVANEWADVLRGTLQEIDGQTTQVALHNIILEFHSANKGVSGLHSVTIAGTDIISGTYQLAHAIYEIK